MTARHHPPETLLEGYVAGTIDHGQHIVLATHLAHCPSCRARARALEHVGGAVIEELPPTPLAANAFDAVAARLSDPRPPAHPMQPVGLADIPGLPVFVRRLRAGPWSWIAPGLHLRRIHLPDASPSRVFF